MKILRSFPRGVRSQGKHLAIVVNAELSGQREDIMGASDFENCILVADTQFENQCPGYFFLHVEKPFARPEEYLLAFIATQARLEINSNPEGFLCVARDPARDRRDHLPREGIDDINFVFG